MSNNKLGRGLSSLIPDGEFFDNEFGDSIALVDQLPLKDKDETSGFCLDLSIDLIQPNPKQPRKSFDDESLKELAQSIKSKGLIQPIVVRKIPNKNFYEIVAGERRWRASKSIGMEVIPAIIKDVDEKGFLEISIIENVQREDINPMEEAEAYKRLVDDFFYTHEDVATMVGKSRSYISNSVRLLGLSKRIQDMVKNKQISIGHAKAIMNSKNPEAIAEVVVEKGLSVRQTESLAKSFSFENEGKVNSNKNKNEDLLLLEEKISENLGMCVKISDNNNIGRVCISFRNLEELNIILRKLS